MVFLVANVMAMLAPSAELMLAARILSGVGAALVMPVTLSVITTTFPDAERSTAIGIWTAVAGGGGMLGMVLSALLVDFADWRYLFVLPIALVLASAALTLRSVHPGRDDVSGRFDVIGALLSVLVAVGLTFALHEGPARGWTLAPSLALACALVALVLFIRWELRHPAPLLDVRAFRRGGLASGASLLLVMFAVQAGVSIVMYPFFQTVLGWSGLLSTLGLLPMAVLMMLASGFAPTITLRFGHRVAMAGGVLLAGVGLALMATLVSVEAGYLGVLPGLITMGLGMGLAMTPSTEAITSSLPPDRQGVASALNDVTRELGAALGVALLGALGTAGYRTALEPSISHLTAAAADIAREGITLAATVLDPDTLRAAQDAFVLGWQQSMWVGAAAFAVMAPVVLLLAPTRAGRR